MSGNSLGARLRRVLCGVVCLALIFAATEFARAKMISSAAADLDAATSEGGWLSSLPPLHEPLVPAAVPGPMRSLVQAQLLGGGEVPTNSWHLSVINGGQPRGHLGESQAPVFSSSWPGESLNKGQWSFRSLDDETTSGDGFTLGSAGATPVTGDFNGDGRAEVGVFVEGQWYVDLNGNGAWDDQDLRIGLGRKSDRPVTGDWDGDGKSDAGIFGSAWFSDAAAKASEAGLPDASNRTTGAFKNLPSARLGLGVRSMQRSAEGELRADRLNHVFQFGAPGDLAVSGDWNGDGIASVGIFRDGHWVLDSDGDGKFSASDVSFSFGSAGDLPVVGDFNGDGVDDVGVFRHGAWFLDTNGDRTLDASDLVIEFGSTGDLPVVGDFAGTGRVQLGIYRAAQGVQAQR